MVGLFALNDGYPHVIANVQTLVSPRVSFNIASFDVGRSADAYFHSSGVPAGHDRMDLPCWRSPSCQTDLLSVHNLQTP
jgi:hypothetical protein